jgi:hypothetical protein
MRWRSVLATTLVLKTRGWGDFRGHGLPGNYRDLCAQIRGEKMDTNSKDDKPADVDLEMAVFGAP